MCADMSLSGMCVLTVCAVPHVCAGMGLPCTCVLACAVLQINALDVRGTVLMGASCCPACVC
jgi:hypothetical protein